MSSAFNETKKLFTNYIGYNRPLSYSEWLAVADDSKAAVLFVQFYEQITLAWFKSKSFFVLEEDGVETVLQYLVKNVPIIAEDGKKFTPSYIYRVAYNCLYCISHDIQRDIERYEREISNIVGYEDEELDLFDTVVDNTYDSSDSYNDQLTRKRFWEIIDNMGPETEKVIYHLLNGDTLGKKTYKPLEIKSKDNAAERARKEMVNAARENNSRLDYLKDVSVTVKDMERIIKELQDKLEVFKDIYHI